MADILVTNNDAIKKAVSEALGLGLISDEDKIAKQRNEENVSFDLVKDMHDKLKDDGSSSMYLNDLVDISQIVLPSVKLPPRNPELEKRIIKLREEQQNREYAKMTENVGPKFGERPKVDPSAAEESFDGVLKAVNRQLIVVFNFVLTVVCSFVFFYKAVEYILPVPNVPAQLCAGLIAATLVFFADIYFLIRHTL